MAGAIDPKVQLRRAVLASVVGNTLEWYDFFLYGTAAALIFGQLFFPVGDSLASTLAAFGSFAVGFAARPLGGFIFGHVGDRHGRKASLIWTLSIMGVATFLIGMLPTYEQIGLLAPAALLFLRILQGIAAGGEWGGGVLMITENAPAHRRGFFGAWSQVGVGMGFVLSSLAFFGAQQLPQEDFIAWGWRVPFLISIVIFSVGVFIRYRVNESAEFGKVASAEQTAAMPFVTLLRRHPREMLVGIGARLAENCGSHLLITFSLFYAKAMGAPTDVMLLGVAVAMLADSMMMPVFGALSDRLGRRPVYMFGAVSMALFGYPFFLMIGSGDPTLMIAALVIGNGICHAAMVGVQPALFSEMFSTEVRYSGLAMAHEISSLIVGVAPMIATALFAYYQSAVPVALYLAAVCFVTFVALCFARPAAPAA
ncbi:MFS transporter [Sphingomonas flavalba]|uniref:MFS transporter n=1 Tax=Sphingomonas flavalba TaxID=2559804 RepID=UPI00109DD6A3|nr:MFS transporter [Sphingomonas flavalba]